MKKKLLKMLVLVSVVYVMSACGNSEKKDDAEIGNSQTEDDTEIKNSENEAYVGTWVRDTWTNDNTGDVLNVTLEFYADGTYKQDQTSSINGQSIITGEWKINSTETIIELCPKKLLSGYNDGMFYENGEYHGIIDEVTTSPGYSIYILDETTLENMPGGPIKYHKQ